jgi:hypothetical protein
MYVLEKAEVRFRIAGDISTSETTISPWPLFSIQKISFISSGCLLCDKVKALNRLLSNELLEKQK